MVYAMTYHHVVSLGSSFASGPGIEPLVDKVAGRSARNYPSLLAAGLGAGLTDRTASGATLANIVDVSQRVGLRKLRPQLEDVPRDADLVTVTAGGNDLGYSISMIRIALANRLQSSVLGRPIAGLLRPNSLPAVTQHQRTALADGLTRVIESVREQMPAARIVLVDYLTVLSSHSFDATHAPFTPAELTALNEVAITLSEVFEETSQKMGVGFIDSRAISTDHAVGSPEPWVVGMPANIRGILSRPPFHPNETGMEAIAAQIQAFLTEASAPGSAE